MKHCSICNLNEAETIFGRDSRCLMCNRSRRKKLYQKNKYEERRKSLSSYWKNRDENIKKMKIYNERIKDEVYGYYGGYVCNCCGETERSFLTIDHIKGGGNEHRRSMKGGGTYICRWIRKNGFPPLFQVLCYNCNIGKARNGNICPHKKNHKK